MTRRMIPVGAALLALALPAAASAKLPSFPSTSIVIKSSIGGVSLGQSQKNAKAAWGTKGGTCTFDQNFGSCTFEAGTSGTAQWTADDGKVTSVRIYTGTTGSTPNFKTPLTALKTSKGIGIGSTLKAVKQAYPTGKGDKNYWAVGGARLKPYTTFVVSSGRVTQITTGDGKHQG